jgi:hypothetical protein
MIKTFMDCPDRYFERSENEIDDDGFLCTAGRARDPSLTFDCDENMRMKRCPRGFVR